MTAVGEKDSNKLLSLWNSGEILGDYHKSEVVPFHCVFLNLLEGWLVLVENEVHSVVARAFANLNYLTLLFQVLNHLVEDACAVLGLSSDQLWPIIPHLKAVLQGSSWLASLGELFGCGRSHVDDYLLWHGDRPPSSWVELALIEVNREHEDVLVVDLVLFSEVLAELANAGVDGVEPGPVVLIEFQLPPVALLVDVALVQLAEVEGEPVEHVQAVGLLAPAESSTVFVVCNCISILGDTVGLGGRCPI